MGLAISYFKFQIKLKKNVNITEEFLEQLNMLIIIININYY